jgi:type IV pilus assembly protein PilO
MDLQDPRIQKLLLGVILSVSLLVFFFFTSLAPFTYQAGSLEIAELKTEHEKLSRDLERARLTVGNMEKVEREFEYLHRQWTVAQRLLPDENEISGLLRKISAAGTQAGLDWVQFTPAPRLAHGFYHENPIDVTLEGGYHQVGTFLSSISNLGRIVNVRGLELEGVDPRQQAEPDVEHTLTASLQVVAYSMDPSASIQAPADASGGSQELASSTSTAGRIKDKLAEARGETRASVGGK